MAAYIDSREVLIVKDYDIVRSINQEYGPKIKAELIKVIFFIVTTINIKKGTVDLAYLSNIFFKDVEVRQGQPPQIVEYGQVGMQELTSLEELREIVLNSNIRELFTMINNARKQIGCLMFELLLEYKEDPNSFMEKYVTSEGNPIFNKDTIEYTINFAENMLDVDIADLAKCYNEEYAQVECNSNEEKLYNKVQNDNTSYPQWTNASGNICFFWLPFTYMIANQNMTKEQNNNKVKDLVSKSIKKKEPFNPDCTRYILDKCPFVEPISVKERAALQAKAVTENNFAFTICSTEPVPNTFTTGIRKKYDKLSVSYTSGHAVLILMFCEYFKDINLNLILLGCIIWLVPYSHSINEIFLAAKEISLFDEYNIARTLEDNYKLIIEKLLEGDTKVFEKRRFTENLPVRRRRGTRFSPSKFRRRLKAGGTKKKKNKSIKLYKNCKNRTYKKHKKCY